MIVAKPTEEDFILYDVLRHPVMCPEFIRNVDIDSDYDEEFKFSWYQKEILCDFNPKVSICTARATGKTVSLSSILMWILVFNVFPGDYALYTVPSKVHLEPVFTELVRMFRSNSFLKNFMEKNAGINSSDYKITTLLGTTLMCRIAGQSGTGANLIGLHTPFIAADECGYFPWNAFQEMQPSENVWTNGHRMMVTGVPTGLRESNVLYMADQENPNYTKHRVSSYDNPRVRKEDIDKAINQYGGEDSDDFIHYVLGRHGRPVFSLFDRNLMDLDVYPVIKLEIDGIKMGDNLDQIITKISSFPKISNSGYGCIMGIDLGYTEPTAIVIMYLDDKDRLKFHGRIKLSKVSYPIQEKVIDMLDTKFNPSIIGMDEGNIGKSVRQHLVQDSEYKHKNYESRLMSIDFSSQVNIGIDSEGKEINVKTKPFTVSILQDYSNNHKLIYSTTDMDMVSELERMTYSKNPNGDIAYRTLTDKGGKRGEDHFTAALLCGVGAYHLTTNRVSDVKKVKLLTPSWIY